jgi:hypothetical protein
MKDMERIKNCWIELGKFNLGIYIKYFSAIFLIKIKNKILE